MTETTTARIWWSAVSIEFDGMGGGFWSRTYGGDDDGPVIPSKLSNDPRSRVETGSEG